MPKAPQTDTQEPDLSTCQANIKALQKHSRLSVNAWALKYGFVQSTVNRIITGKLDPTAGMLEVIAEKLGLFGWQLLVPNLDPQSPPVIREATAAEVALYKRLRQTIDELAELREGGNSMPGEFDQIGGTRIQDERTANKPKKGTA